MMEPGYGRLRASQADRERAIDVLNAAFAEGRLDPGEHADRVGQAHASRTYADLGALVADLPVGPLGTLGTFGTPGTLVPAPLPAVPPAPSPGPIRARAPRRRNELETATLAMVVLIIPAMAILFAVVSALGLVLHA